MIIGNGHPHAIMSDTFFNSGINSFRKFLASFRLLKMRFTEKLVPILIFSVLFSFIFTLSSAYSASEIPIKADTPQNFRIFIKRENIALNKKYTFNQPPNYSYTTDSGDIRQLTDDKYSKDNFWVQPSTVGWTRTNPVTIEIDLGSIRPISGVLYNTAAGVTDVRWPWAILIFVSNDSKDYQYVGDLTALDQEGDLPAAGTYAVHSFWTDKLNTEGRYVKLEVIPNGRYTFVDEIQIFKGSQTRSVESVNSQSAQISNSEIIRDRDAFIEKTKMQTGVQRRLASDLKAIRGTLDGVENTQQIEIDLDAIEKEIHEVQDIEIEGFSTVFPMNDLHHRIFKIQAEIWRKKGLKGIALWQQNRWDMLSPTDMPISDMPQIDVKMMQNEYRSAAFNISNATDNTVKLPLSIRDLPSGIDPKFIDVRAGLFTDTVEGIPVMAALPSADQGSNGYSVEIAPGLTRQIWLTFSSKELNPGTYKCHITVGNNGVQIPITLKVYPYKLPDNLTLHLGGWDYTNVDNQNDVTPSNRNALIQNLKKHYVDSPWANRKVFPTGQYDNSGKMIVEPDTKNFKAWIQRWPKAKNYFVFIDAREENFGGLKVGTASFDRAIGNWISFWVNELKSLDINAAQLGLMIVDEPSTVKKSQLAIKYAKAIKTEQPKVQIFETVAWKKPWEAPPELFEYSDVLCIELSNWTNADSQFLDFYANQKKAGRKLWFYSAKGPAKLLDPYGYHRLAQWYSWQHNAKGSCFWAFGDSNGGSSWNAYLVRDQGSYSPLFLDATSVTTGKHMEAIREGVQDYEYLRILHDRIKELESSSKKSAALDSAKKLLSSAARRVTTNSNRYKQIMWNEAKDRSVADQVVEEILDTLEALTK